MATLKAQRAGGIANARIQRQKSIERYYLNPNCCGFCKKVIAHKVGQKVADTRKKKYCNHSCTAKSTNASPKRKKVGRLCPTCKSLVYSIRSKNGNYWRSKYCKPCKSTKDRVDNLGLKTKGQLFRECKNWQSARSTIRGHAHRAYVRSGRPLICENCGYKRHAEIAHRISVSSFIDETPISIINDLLNLMALCPTHHWEQENGFVAPITSGLQTTFNDWIKKATRVGGREILPGS